MSRTIIRWRGGLGYGVERGGGNRAHPDKG
jgi:hypothetical protein